MKRRKFKFNTAEVRRAIEFIRKCRRMKAKERAERDREEQETERLIERAWLADGEEMTP